jgi:hypothetical protein
MNCHYLKLISLKIMLMCGSSFGVAENQVECTESYHVGVKVVGGSGEWNCDRQVTDMTGQWQNVPYYLGRDRTA